MTGSSDNLIAEGKDPGESGEIGRAWLILPKPAVEKQGWLVYTPGFLLTMLQGKTHDPGSVRKTVIWRAVTLLFTICLALFQVLVMILARIPVVNWVASAIAQYAGRDPLGFALRSCYWKARLKSLGQDTLIDQGVEIHGASRVAIGHDSFLSTNVRLSAGGGAGHSDGGIAIGDYSYIGPSSLLSGSGSIRIGDFVAVSASVCIYSATNTHYSLDRPAQLLSMSHGAPPDRQQVLVGYVDLEDYVTVSPNTVILPNVRLGTGSIVHSFCQVSRSFPAFANIVGPGRAKQNGWRRPLRDRDAAGAAKN